MGTYLYKYINLKNEKKQEWIEASTWAIAQKRFSENNKDVKEIISAKKHS
jgi:hypothetical protein